MPKKNIGLIVDFDKKEAMKLANEVKDWLEKGNYLTFIKSIPELTDSFLQELSFIITFGGDGLVLKTANAVAPYNIPMARVNFGTVGFLCNIEPDRILWNLKKILADQFHIETRSRIRAKIVKENKEIICEFDAFNEIVVGSTPEKKTTWLKVKIIEDSEKSKKTRTLKTTGDGLIIATKSGSTGYCLSAGGPVLLEDAFAVVASNGHFESGFLPPYAKSFVTPSDDVWFEITVLRGGQNLPCVKADSDDKRTRLLKEGEKVIISKSTYKNLFIEF